MDAGGPAAPSAPLGQFLLDVEHALVTRGAERADLRVKIFLHGEQSKAIGDLPVDRQIAVLRERRTCAGKCKCRCDTERWGKNAPSCHWLASWLRNCPRHKNNYRLRLSPGTGAGL